MSRAGGVTAISSLGDGDDVLTYRGYAIADLVARASFEDTAFLLLRGRLPTRDERDAYRDRLVGLRTLPPALTDVLERVPDSGGPTAGMDALRTGVSLLGALEPERPEGDPFLTADRLLATAPGMMAYWLRFAREGIRIGTETGQASTAGHILAMLRDGVPDETHRRVLDASLVLYADLAFNASTFACRVCASTRSDVYSCVTAGIATLRGPLHGGASAEVAAMLDAAETPTQAEAAVAARLDRRERVTGFGHAIFRTDPRSPILEALANRLAAGSGALLLAKARRIDRLMRDRKGLAPNVDFYTACCYRLMGLDRVLFAPLFVCARVAGWCAHVAEQRGDKSLIHPSAVYNGPAPRPLPDLDLDPLGDGHA